MITSIFMLIIGIFLGPGAWIYHDIPAFVKNKWLYYICIAGGFYMIGRGGMPLILSLL